MGGLGSSGAFWGIPRALSGRYDPAMVTRLSAAEVHAAREARLEAMHLQAMEANPLSPDEIAMFEMFEREAWPHEQRRAYILGKAKSLAAAE